MTTTEQPADIDMDKLMGFLFQAAGDIGATLNTALVVMGDRLGLYRAMAGAGPLTPAELARRTGTAERYIREWLNTQAAGAYVDYDPDSGRYSLPLEHAAVLADESSPAYLPGVFQNALGSLIDSPRITEAVKTGEGVGWHEHNQDVFDGCERGLRPGYNANLISAWLPALDGVVAKLERGAAVADVGCGHGASTILMAQAFPASTFVGSDYHEGSDGHGAVRCGLPAAVEYWYAVESTSGPLESAKIRCPRGHGFNGPVEDLTVPGGSQPTRRARRGPANRAGE